MRALERLAHAGCHHRFLEVWRANFFLAFRDEDEVDRRLATGATDGVQGREEGGLRPFLVGGAAADQDRALAGHFDELRLPGRRAPLGGDGLLHVVHEIEGDRYFGAGVERREHCGVALGRDALRVLEAGVEREFPHQLGAFLHADVLGRDRGLVDPFLEARNGFVVAALDFVIDVAELALGGGAGRPRGGPERGAGGGGVGDEVAARDSGHGVLP